MLIVAKKAKIAHFIGENPVFSLAYFSCTEACSARVEAYSVRPDACSVFPEAYSTKIPQAGTFFPQAGTFIPSNGIFIPQAGIFWKQSVAAGVLVFLHAVFDAYFSSPDALRIFT